MCSICIQIHTHTHTDRRMHAYSFSLAVSVSHPLVHLPPLSLAVVLLALYVGSPHLHCMVSACFLLLFLVQFEIAANSLYVRERMDSQNGQNGNANAHHIVGKRAGDKERYTYTIHARLHAPSVHKSAKNIFCRMAIRAHTFKQRLPIITRFTYRANASR